MIKGISLKRVLPPLLLIMAGALAYWNSFEGVFLFDGLPSVRDNVYIRTLWPVSRAMSVPLWSTGLTVDGRPLLSLSFALNQALFGPEPWGYHLVNLLIHITSGILLFGVVRRTLELPQFRDCFRDGTRRVALATALVWLVHPLHTESVTYMVQRAESLMGMLFLLTMYCAIRGFGKQEAGSGEGEGREHRTTQSVASNQFIPPGRDIEQPTSKGEGEGNFRLATPRAWFSERAWLITAVISCGLGMGVKQTIFSAPLLVCLYDRIFISGSFRDALSKRKRFYASLCATWLIVFGIIGATWEESTIDFVKISPIRYLCTQPMVLLHYLRLSVWPSPLVLAYGWTLEEEWYRIVFPGLAVIGALAIMFRGIGRGRWYGFVIAWFFLILAPTSSIAPMRQAIFEHRMYLSLASVVVLAVVGAHHAVRRLCSALRVRVILGGCLLLALLSVLTCLTHSRNKDYHDAVSMWRGNLVYRPQSRLAHFNLARTLSEKGCIQDAKPHFTAALHAGPESAYIHRSWGEALKESGQMEEAVGHYEQALRINPDYAEAHNSLGDALQSMGKSEEALSHYQKAASLKPGLAHSHIGIGDVLRSMGRSRDAIQYYSQALQIDSHRAEVHNNLGLALQQIGLAQEAIGHYERALQLDPDQAEIHNNFGNVLQSLGRVKEAAPYYRDALEINPDYAEAHNNMGNAVLALGRPLEAIPHYREALRVDPGQAEVHYNLGRAVLKSGLPDQAIGHYERALKLRSDMSDAHYNLGNALALLGRTDEAVLRYQRVVELDPKHVPAHNNLATMYRQSGRIDDAIKHLELALKLQPYNDVVRENLRQTRLLRPAGFEGQGASRGE